MRRSTLYITALILCLAAPRADSAPFIPKMNTIDSYKAARYGADEVRKNIDTVDCGGLGAITQATVNGGTVTGDMFVPDISQDLPGRDNVNPLGMATGGVGQRGDFFFPDSTYGFSSACDIRQQGYDDPDVGWIEINPEGWCLRFDKATPTWCKRLYDKLKGMQAGANRWPYGDQVNQCFQPKRYCFDDTSECFGQQCRTLNPPSFYDKSPRCHYETADDGTVSVVRDDPGSHQSQMSSFYRHYAGAFKQPGITVKAYKDGPTLKEWKLRAECYEYYKEQDPKDIVTGKDLEQCEVIISYPQDEQNPDSPEWPNAGAGRQQKNKIKPDPGEVQELPRDNRNVPQPWVADQNTNLNLIDSKKLSENQEDFLDPFDLAGVIDTILPVKQRASKNVPDQGRTDMFDDTDHRGMSKFWEAQQKELLKMVTEPRTVLVMPAKGLVGLSRTDPLLQYVSGVVSRPSGITEFTLRAGTEDLGNVLQSFFASAVSPSNEVRIPLLVPLVSDEELSTRIFDWQQWKKSEDKQAAKEGRASLSGDADALIDKLNTYKTAVRKERLMRGALAKYLQKFFAGQKQNRQFIADWFTQNQAAMDQAKLHAEQRTTLKNVWRKIQRSMLQTDECQLQWCSNQRYSTPVYSLLDEWWGVAPPGGNRDPNYKPRDLRDLGYVMPNDQVFDFSKMGFPRDGYELPVLWPVQVAITLPIPPKLGEKPPSVSQFPDLPNYPGAEAFDALPVPGMDLPAPSLVTPPPAPDLQAAIDIMREFRKIVDGKSVSEQIQEEADDASGATPPDPDQFAKNRTDMRGTYCRFIPSIMIKPDPADEHGYSTKIIHVENDLRERVARFFSRWMPNIMVDFAGRVARRNVEPSTDPPNKQCREDIVCVFLPPEKTTITSWQWFAPDEKAPLTGFANQMKSLTLPPDDDSNPYKNSDLDTLKRIFPQLDYPITVDVSFPLTP